MGDNTAEQIAHKLGIPWPSAEEGLLRQAAAAFDAAATAVDGQKDACSAKVHALTASNSGGGMEQFASFWGRYDGGSGAMPATSEACRQMATALRQYADEVEKTKNDIRTKVEIAGAALVVGAVAAIFTFGATEAVAAAAAAAIAEFAASAGIALSATVATIIGTALAGAAFGAVESIAIDALVVQPLSAALGQQKGFSFDELLHAGEFGAAGGLVAGGAGGAMGRLPAAAGAAEAGGMPRLASTLDGLTSFTGTTGGRLLTGGMIGAGTTEALAGGHASGLDVLAGTLGGFAGGAGGRGRTPVDETLPPRLARDDDDFAALLNYKGVPKAHIVPPGDLVPANPEGLTTLPQHIIGDNSTPEIKGNSPYISFKPPDNTGKSFGADRVEVDLLRLEQDVRSGRVRGVEVLRPEQIQAQLQSAVDEAAGRHLDVPESFASPDERAAFFKDAGLTGARGREARRLVQALQNTLRDDEWLIRGTIPARYLFGPAPVPQVAQP